MKITMFCGGRGSSEIIKALMSTNGIELTLLINGFDDGKSTGVIRDIVPGILGPSDFRKNISVILANIEGKQGVAKLLESRITTKELINLNNFENCSDYLVNLLSRFSKDLTVDNFTSFSKWLTNIGNEIEQSKSSKEDALVDMAIGNLLLAGCFLETNREFNYALEVFQNAFNLPVEILNITNGDNLVLIGLDEEGNILKNESAIVSMGSSLEIVQIFLLEKYLTDLQLKDLGKLNLNEKIAYLSKIQKKAEINSKVERAITDSDLIVYGPGTQHSSLFPSYMTNTLGSLIANQSKVKMLIGNLSEDNDIKNENLSSLLIKMEKYFNLWESKEHEIDKYVNQIFLSNDSVNYVPWGYKNSFFEDKIKIFIGQIAGSNSKHDGIRVVNGILTMHGGNPVLRENTKYERVSIILPNLNEARTIGKVLEKLYLFDWIGSDIIPEFILIDSNSNDNSIEIANSFPNLKIIRLPKNLGRGFALKAGIMKATGKLIVTFPTDDEYSPQAIVDVSKSLRQNLDVVVFGSRATLSVDTSKRLREIYKGNYSVYLLSKWGGNALTIIAGLRFKRWVSDPLTSIKGFSIKNLENLSLNGNSVNWDTKIIVDASKNLIPIVEIPVDYRPRNRINGKKISVFDGLRALVALLMP